MTGQRKRCHDPRPCFARINGGCALIGYDKPMYKDGECPFCKPDREVTNGVYYPTRTEGRYEGKVSF